MLWQRTPAGAAAAAGQQVCVAPPVIAAVHVGLWVKASPDRNSLSNHITVTFMPVCCPPDISAEPWGNSLRTFIRQVAKSKVARVVALHAVVLQLVEGVAGGVA